MEYDIIFVLGELFFDHPLSGAAILKRLLEKHGYNVGVIEKPTKEEEVKKLGKPKLFFAVSSGAIDSMVRNYTPLKKKRDEDKYSDYEELVPDKAVVVYCNWIKKNFKESLIVIGGTEASLRRFVHYDYWENRLRKSILFDSRADLLVYGNGEKQILEIAERTTEKLPLDSIEGTCIVSRIIPENFKELPSEEEVTDSKEKFCEMQLDLNNHTNLAQKSGQRYILQYKSPLYTSKDLDEYYELPFSRNIPLKSLRGFEFSIVTHRGCIGNCNFCAINLIQGNKIISRSEESILKEIKNLAKLPYFKGNVDDLGGPSANMYGMDCNRCDICHNDCLKCEKLDKSHSRLLQLLKKSRTIPGIRKIYLRSGIRYDFAPKIYIKEIAEHHLYDTLRIAPEHTDENVLQLMNKDKGNFKEFLQFFNSLKCGKKLSYYFITAHPGSSMKEAKELAEAVKGLDNLSLQVFTPTPMTTSTCMYYTGMDPKSKEKIYVPYTYSEKKEQKRVVLNDVMFTK
ncbi:MAG: YgiQ family radical SAM protein [Nanoarchaeota archaeon]|nr:YgiQ family radical SAM protein [Nanoarchaeota archaeon]MBU1631850.1 YgiQ family radical SAM protein [Nanoarchaeota archaeon]MBU1875843.1 YgiQ family radical SAM protein [Nanoarchaeota archaeon]